MKPPAKIFVVLAITLACTLIVLSQLEAQEPPNTGITPPTLAEVRETHRHGTYGIRLLSQFTETTILAKNPMLIMGVGGAIRYAMASAERRERLGFFARPSVFGLFLTVAILVLTKDILLSWFAGLKMPLDALAEFAHMAGGVLGVAFMAAGIFDGSGTGVIPVVDRSLGGQQAGFVHAHDGSLGLGVFAAGDAGVSLPGGESGSRVIGFFQNIVNGITFVMSLFVYVVVFVVFNGIEAAIVINPFPLVDMFLKGCRTTIIGFITGLSMIHPVLGFLAALLVFLMALWMFHFSVRLTTISVVYSLGILRRVFGNPGHVKGEKLRAFSCWSMQGVPWFTYGRLRRNETGEIEFVYKWLFVIWECSVPLPTKTTAVGIGTVNPYLLGQVGEKPDCPLLRFSPRYCGQEAWLAKYMRLERVKDISLTNSIKQAIRFLWDCLPWRRAAAGTA